MHATFDLYLDRPVPLLRVVGELDLAEQHPLHHHTADLRDHATGSVALDLGGVTFIDAGCLRVLDSLRSSLADGGRSITISDASATFRRVCHLALYDDLGRTVRGRRAAPLQPLGGPRRVVA